MKNYRTAETTKHLLMLYILVQPILEIKYLWDGTYLGLYGISFSFFVRFALLQVIFLLVVFNRKEKKDLFMWLGYGAIVAIYTIFHHLNVIHYPINLPINYSYSLFSEVSAIVKLIMPIQIIYVVVRSSLTKEECIRLLSRTGLIFVYVLIICNLFKIGWSSYMDLPIVSNIFGWFSGEYLYYETATRGIYLFVNPLSLVVSMLTGLILLDKSLKFRMLHVCAAVLAGLIIGPKVAAFGPILTIGCNLIIRLFLYLRSKESLKGLLILLLPLLLFAVLYPFSPASQRESERDLSISEANGANPDDPDKGKKVRDITTMSDLEKTVYRMSYADALLYTKTLNREAQIEALEFIKEDSSIAPWFTDDRYPIENDPEFWIELFASTPDQRLNFRYLQTEIVKRVVELRNSPYDMLLGQSIVLNHSVMFIERDYIAQYYTLGIFGLLLFILPYFYAPLRFMFSRKVFAHTEVEYTLLAIVCLGLSVALYSGNIFEFQLSNSYIAFISGLLLKFLGNNDEENKYYF